MARQIQQTKNAIEKLKASGFARKDYSVKTPKDKNGEWGYAEITINNDPKGVDLIPNMIAQGLYVRFYDWHKFSWAMVFDHTPRHFSPDEKGGHLQTIQPGNPS